MSSERQQQRLSPPPAYMNTTPSSMENEMYIDGIAVDHDEQQTLALKQHQNNQNPCGQFFRTIRSNLFEIVNKIWKNMCEQPFANL
jgi:hypothetical protein